MMIATAEEGAGRTAEAVETLRAAIEDNPKFFRGLVMLAELSEKQGEWDSAADAYARAQALNPRIDLASRRAAALINAGKAAEARDLLKPGAAKPDAEPMVLYLYAAALRQTGDLAGAEAAARRLRAAAPNDPRGLTCWPRCWRRARTSKARSVRCARFCSVTARTPPRSTIWATCSPSAASGSTRRSISSSGRSSSNPAIRRSSTVSAGPTTSRASSISRIRR